jgi:RES domain-containing protein
MPGASKAEQLAASLAVKRVQWRGACRIVPTRHPSVYLYDRVADAADFDALYALEALTNDRVRDEIGAVQLVAPEDRVFGPGSGPIMAAFTHVNPSGSRFSDGAYGMFYAARERATAVAETAHHHARFLAATNEGPMHLPMRLYHVAVDARLHDLRAPGAVPAGVFDASDYSAARALGRTLRARGSHGVVYPSVRHARGQCVGLFRPRGAKDCLHAAILLYAWDGQRFTDIYEKL